MRLKINLTEPRVTRRQLSIGSGKSCSLSTTPTRVELNRCQNLSNILRPRRPIIPEAVDPTRVQNLSEVLALNAPSGRRLRNKPRVDYFKLHHGEDSSSK